MAWSFSNLVSKLWKNPTSNFIRYHHAFGICSPWGAWDMYDKNKYIYCMWWLWVFLQILSAPKRICVGTYLCSQICSSKIDSHRILFSMPSWCIQMLSKTLIAVTSWIQLVHFHWVFFPFDHFNFVLTIYSDFCFYYFLLFCCCCCWC